MPPRVLPDLDSGPSLHTVYAYLTGLLLALVGIKYQGLNSSPFKEHPAIMILFLLAITVYVMALLILRSDQINHIIQHASNLIMVLVWMCHVSGSVACELLVLVLVSPIWCFIINVSSLVLVLTLLFCYNYLFQPSLLVPDSVEGQVTEMASLEAAITSDP